MNQASAARKTIAQKRKAKPVIILGNVPKGYHWVWHSREDPRMHLQTVDATRMGDYKVWLEKDGKRVLEPAGDIPAKVLKALRAEVEKRRRNIEGQWTWLMMKNKWLTVHMRGREVTVTAYPGVPGARFVRTFDMAEHFPGLYDPTYRITPRYTIKPEDVGLSREIPALEVYTLPRPTEPDHIDLTPILWHD